MHDGPIPNAYRPEDADPGYYRPAELRAAPTGSPRPLVILRDILISLACVMLLAYGTVAAYAVVRAGNAINDLGTTSDTTPTPGPCFIPDDPTCTPPGD